ncbi:MAG: Cell wall-binding protein YocH precursor [Pelotomaculum sp. PtaB.Bin104]|nr:MAG: Cell wall-binding protein YocH precursor [Pelotomaculum sp. PtaB.Bin104]
MSWSRLEALHRKFDGMVLRLPRQRGVLLKWAAVTTVVVALLVSCYVWKNKSVTLSVDGNEIKVQTFAGTVGGVLQANGIAVLDKDEVEPSIESPLQDGMLVTVKHALDLTIAVDGGTLPVRTMAQQVGDVLVEYGIETGPDDEVFPVKDAPVTPGMTVQVVRVRVDTIESEVLIDHETKKQYTVKMPSGESRVAQEGKEGKERQIWQVLFKDGREVNRQLASREVIEPAVDKVVMVGSGMTVSRGGENIRYSETLDLLATGYTYTGSNTASGAAPHYGVAAVDTSVIKMGTRLYVEGYGYATALDRGGAIRGNRIDLFFESYNEAMRWGSRRVKAYVID